VHEGRSLIARLWNVVAGWMIAGVYGDVSDRLPDLFVYGYVDERYSVPGTLWSAYVGRKVNGGLQKSGKERKKAVRSRQVTDQGSLFG
jgi:hypothetical protein